MRHDSCRMLAFGLALGLACLLARLAGAAFDVSLDKIKTGDTPAGPAPWLQATFEDQGDDASLAAGTVRLTLTSHLSGDDFLQGGKNALAWLFNLNTSKNAGSLSFSFVSGTEASGITKATDGAKLSPFSNFDVGFQWDSKSRFEAGDIAVYTITISGGGLAASDFEAKNGDGYYSAAHVQGIEGGGSSKIYADTPTPPPPPPVDPQNITAVPVPPAFLMFLSAAPFLLAGTLSRRRKPATA